MSVTSPPRGILEESVEPRGRVPSRRWIDVVLVVALLPMALVARRPGYLFSHSFFLDEGWVADSVRAPLRRSGCSPPRPRSAGPCCCGWSPTSVRRSGCGPWRCCSGS